MKTMKFILACVLLLSPLLCQAQKNLFNKYNDMKGVSSVYISKATVSYTHLTLPTNSRV